MVANPSGNTRARTVTMSGCVVVRLCGAVRGCVAVIRCGAVSGWVTIDGSNIKSEFVVEVRRGGGGEGIVGGVR